jgi:hypothetical protein
MDEVYNTYTEVNCTEELLKVKFTISSLPFFNPAVLNGVQNKNSSTCKSEA